MEKKLVVFIDCGDTLVDESTQKMAFNGDVLSAKMIPGAYEMLTGLKRDGYRIALVADGRSASFHNIFRELGLLHIFDAWIISQEVGAEKPDARMFEAAMDAMGLTRDDLPRIVMIGNNIQRDVLGANRMGICSILLDYSPRYCMVAQSAHETPDYRVSMPAELTPLLDRLNRQLARRQPLTHRAAPVQ